MEANNLTYELHFKNETPNRVEFINEPWGMDAATLAIERKPDGFARDVYVVNEDTELYFYADQRHAFFYLLDYFNTYGSEAVVSLVVYDDGVQILSHDLDFAQCETDGYTFIKCKSMDSGKRTTFKVHQDLTIDAYASSDLDGQTAITPLQPIKCLLQAKPVVQKSVVTQARVFVQAYVTNFPDDSRNFVVVPFANTTNVYGVKDTLVPFDPFRYGQYGLPDGPTTDIFNGAARVIKAQNALTNIVVKLSFDSLRMYCGNFNGVRQLTVYWGPTIRTAETEGTYVNLVDVPIGTIQNYTQGASNYTVNIPFVPQGGSIWVCFQANTPGLLTYIEAINTRCEITATAQFIPTVIEGVRLIDMMKQTATITAQIGVDAPSYDVGGPHYNTLAVNGYGVRSIFGKPFSVKPKAVFDTVKELCHDYHVGNDAISILPYADFYDDMAPIQLIAATPANEFKITPNPDYLYKSFEYGYKSYEQDRQEGNTIDAVHTATEWRLNTKKRTDVKKVDLDHIRDAFKIEALRRQGATSDKSTTSLSEDDTLILLDFVPIGSSSTQTWIGYLEMQAAAGILKILSGGWDWRATGVAVNTTFVIAYGPNQGSYNVTAVESGMLTLAGGAASFTGAALVKIQYQLFGVLYKTRTNEGFADIQGVEAPENYANLRYSIRRNMQHWEQHLATAALGTDGTIKNGYWKANGNLRSTLIGEAEIVEKADINTNLVTPILGPNLVDCTVFIDPTQAKAIADNPNKSVAVYDVAGRMLVHGWLKTFRWLYADGKAELSIEQAYNDGILRVNKSDVVRAEVHDQFITLVGVNGAMTEWPLRVAKIRIDGIEFATPDDLLQYLA